MIRKQRKDCGCSRIHEKVGDKFGCWEVVEIPNDKGRGRYKNHTLICKCKCGKVRRVQRAYLRNGLSTACQSCSAISKWAKIYERMESLKAGVKL